jgi:hypothetical protein
MEFAIPMGKPPDRFSADDSYELKTFAGAL